MSRKVIILFLSMFMLSGCIDGFRNYFTKSANNQLIDTKGFKGGKRKPLYNNKYITLAKKNIAEDNIDDNDDNDDDDNPLGSETIDPTKRNREMYIKMIKRDIAKYKKENGESPNEEMTLNKANKKIRQNDSEKEKKLEEELAQIKAMLKDAKRDISKYACPNAVPATTVKQNYTPPVTNYEPISSTPINPIPLNKKSKVKQKFIREDDDAVVKNGACSI